MLIIKNSEGNVLRTVNLVNCPWGQVQSCVEYCRGLKFVSTPSHGGYLVAKVFAKKHLSVAAQKIGVAVGNYLAYEQDVKAMVIDIELHDIIKPNRTKDEILVDFVKWVPEYLEYLKVIAQ
jgi:hypothetical protein